VATAGKGQTKPTVPGTQSMRSGPHRLNILFVDHAGRMEPLFGIAIHAVLHERNENALFYLNVRR
jgi:3-hydroxymyristoyl/3-hydroxydecanoyl-(acyl carrier protein) dehydratase